MRPGESNTGEDRQRVCCYLRKPTNSTLSPRDSNVALIPLNFPKVVSRVAKGFSVLGIVREKMTIFLLCFMVCLPVVGCGVLRALRGVEPRLGPSARVVASSAGRPMCGLCW